MKTRLFFALAVAALCGFAFADEKKADGAVHVDANGAEKLIKEGKVTIIDVRTPDEYRTGHISGAKVVDFTENDFETEIGKLDRSKSYLVHCASGNRSGKALATFKKLGFAQVYHLDGGMRAWEAASKPVERL